MLRRAHEIGTILGYQICAEALPISHLLFADDTLIFYGAEEEQAEAIRQLLHQYEEASGQAMNLAKTQVFSKGVKCDRRSRITHLLDIREILSYDKYLGLPTFVGRSR